MNIIVAILVFLTASGQQNIIEEIGFNQASVFAKEGEEQTLRIRLVPNSVDTDISGRVIPLSVSQYTNYEFISYQERQNQISLVVQNVIDEPERE